MHARSTPGVVRMRVLAQARGGETAAQPDRLWVAVFGSGPRGLPEGIEATSAAHAPAPARPRPASSAPTRSRPITSRHIVLDRLSSARHGVLETTCATHAAGPPPTQPPDSTFWHDLVIVCSAYVLPVR